MNKSGKYLLTMKKHIITQPLFMCMVSLAIIIVLLFPSCRSGKNPEQARPNILWITIEDTSPHFIGCFGDINARTPVIDRLAGEGGVRFTNAFATGTVCSPSRSAIITGVKTYKTGTGNQRSEYPIPEFIKGFPYYLRNQGYYTSNNQKTDYNIRDEKIFVEGAWDESSGNAGWWNRKPGQPFFAVFNFLDSHQSRTMHQTYEWYEKNVLNHLSLGEVVGDNEFDLPPFYHDSPEMRKQFARVYNSIKLTDNKIGELISRLEKDNLMDSTIILFFADHGQGVPRGKTNGINFGYRVPFIIWFPEMYKHLSPWGTDGIVTSELIDFTDLAPSLISITGGTIPDYMEGRPFLGQIRREPGSHLFLSSDRNGNGIDMVRSVTDGKYMYSRNFMAFMPELRHMRYMDIGEITQLMRHNLAEGKLNPLQKSLFENRPAEFLFDIENDLWETRNLAEETEYKPVLEQMRKLLKEEVIRSRDVLFLPEYEIALLSKFTTPYEFRMDSNNYPVEKIYEAASLAGFRGPEAAAKQAALLENPDKIIRYWAALGLMSQSQDVLKQYSQTIIKAMDDIYPPVAVTASAIAYEVFDNKSAGENLKRYCAGDNRDISLMSVNYLLYVSNKDPFIQTIWNVIKMTDRDYNVRTACTNFLGNLGLIPNHPDYLEKIN
jgi:arylsulfatase A-like enzyme